MCRGGANSTFRDETPLHPASLSQVNVCRRFLELRDLKNEIGLGACSGVAWAQELQPSIMLLRRRIVSLQEQIWCYRSASAR